MTISKAASKKIFGILRKMYPDAHCELNFRSPLELLVATILSAQCTDVRVNIVTKELFRVFKKPEDYFQRPQSELEEMIRTTGFFRNKAKNIRDAMKVIVEKHDGKVPRTMEALVALPGVGRKTANVILGNAFSLPGLPVDTHVIRVSNRLGLTEQQEPERIEKELTALLPPEDWCRLSHELIFHGRRTCKARNPLCGQCELAEYCRFEPKPLM